MGLIHGRHGTRAEFRPINPVYARLVRMLGPADSSSWEDPLRGTKHDPRVTEQQQHEQVERYRARAFPRWFRWNRRLHGHNPMVVPPPPTEGAVPLDQRRGG